MKVLILYSVTPDGDGNGRLAGEFDMVPSVNCIAAALPGSVVSGVRGELREVIEALERHKPDVVFNLCEAPMARPDREHHVAAVLEWLGVPFTGSGSETLALCRRKDRTYAVLAAAGVPIPRQRGFPCVVKPIDEDGSYGIHCNSLCASEDDIARARLNFPGPSLVEEFLPGREFTVSVWGPSSPDYISPGELMFFEGVQLYTYAAKWLPDSSEYINTPVWYDTEMEPELRHAVLDTARAAWLATGARGYLRVDMRQDIDGTPRVMDVNANPALAPGVGVGRAAVEYGWTLEQLIHSLVEWAC